MKKSSAASHGGLAFFLRGLETTRPFLKTRKHGAWLKTARSGCSVDAAHGTGLYEFGKQKGALPKMMEKHLGATYVYTGQGFEEEAARAGMHEPELNQVAGAKNDRAPTGSPRLVPAPDESRRSGLLRRHYLLAKTRRHRYKKAPRRTFRLTGVNSADLFCQRGGVVADVLDSVQKFQSGVDVPPRAPRGKRRGEARLFLDAA